MTFIGETVIVGHGKVVRFEDSLEIFGFVAEIEVFLLEFLDAIIESLDFFLELALVEISAFLLVDC